MAQIREMIELPLRHPTLFRTLGLKPPHGVLLFGPSGSGKAILARATANEFGADFIQISGPEIMSKGASEAAANLRTIFADVIQSARSTVIFIDSIDVLTRDMQLIDDVVLTDIAKETHGFVAADLSALCREAAMLCVREAIATIDIEENDIIDAKMLLSVIVSQRHFVAALGSKKLEFYSSRFGFALQFDTTLSAMTTE
eukprot:gene4789-6119_t